MKKTLDIKHIHMVGIGGIGMSALADVFSENGSKITGSDLKSNRLTLKLVKKGCVINIGHDTMPDSPSLVVRSFGIKDSNPEILQARTKGIPVINRSELLKYLIDKKNDSICVTGTHGKTTTSSMIAYIFDRAGKDPTVLIGGELDHFQGNAKRGNSDIIIAETDESEPFFSEYRSKYAVITNVEKEHMENYGSFDSLIIAFNKFVENIRDEGVLVYCRDEGILSEIAKKCNQKKVSYGFSDKADFYADSLITSEDGTSFECFRKRKRLGKVFLKSFGKHNVLNALAALAVSTLQGIEPDAAIGILKDFKGLKRRFEIRAKKNGKTIIEDYAHHPTEIRSVIDMANNLRKKKLIVVFQPHRFSRTKEHREEFGKAFAGVSRLVISDIYPANEMPIKGITADTLVDEAKKNGLINAVRIEKSLIPAYLGEITKKGDVILILGAGDINQIIPETIKKI